MKHQIYQVDAFTQETFGGNPACVVPLTSWLSDEQLLHIAKENAVAETAFFVPKDDHFHLRWFTPDIEIDLCGHATLAASHVIHTTLSQRGTPIRFETLSGTLTVAISGGVYYLDLPARPPVLSELPENIWEALSLKPKVVMKARDYILVYDDPSDIAAIQINRERFDQINLGYG
ncbi:PhzF family phenazine biosynthesis isomerase, partial [Winogradskyella sp.]|nr:PhzF family phenazine biosynthesis isomerase [Winogradskyella sp.]